VIDSQGHVLEDNTRPRGEQVMHPAVADTVTDVLTGVIQTGTGTGAAIGRPAAGKTGTAEEYRAAWFVGYTPQLSTAVWMGYADEPKPLENIDGYGVVTGGSIPATAWAQFMGPAHQSLPVVDFPEPGPLPAPTGESSLAAGTRDYPTSPPLACGGLCDRPAPSDDEVDEDDKGDDDAKGDDGGTDDDGTDDDKGDHSATTDTTEPPEGEGDG
jgi:penicillin-binding protein 1A